MLSNLVAGNNLALRINVRESLMKDGYPDYPTMIDKGFTLYRLKYELGLLDATMVVAAMIAGLCGSFNVSKNMTTDQIQDFAVTFLEENIHGSSDQPSLRVEDLAVFCELARTGKFGRPYNYIDGALINQWLYAYKVERDKNYYDWITIGRYTSCATESVPKSPERKAMLDNIITMCLNGKEEVEAKANDGDDRERRRQEYIDRQRRNFYKDK